MRAWPQVVEEVEITPELMLRWVEDYYGRDDPVVQPGAYALAPNGVWSHLGYHHGDDVIGFWQEHGIVYEDNEVAWATRDLFRSGNMIRAIVHPEQRNVLPEVNVEVYGPVTIAQLMAIYRVFTEFGRENDGMVRFTSDIHSGARTISGYSLGEFRNDLLDAGYLPAEAMGSIADGTPTPQEIEDWLHRNIGPAPEYSMLETGAYVLSPTGVWYRLGQYHFDWVIEFYRQNNLPHERFSAESTFFKWGHLVRSTIGYSIHGYELNVDVRMPLTLAQLRAIYAAHNYLSRQGEAVAFYGDIEYFPAGVFTRTGSKDLPHFRELLAFTGYLPAEAEALVAAYSVNDPWPTILLGAGAAIGLYLWARGH